MKKLSIILSIVLLIACIVFCVFAFMGHTAAWSGAAVCGCSAGIISTIIFNKHNKNQ